MAEETKPELAPGRELDKLIAEEVFGYEVIITRHTLKLNPSKEVLVYATKDHGMVLPYSTDIAAAWQVLEHLKLEYTVEVYAGYEQGKWACTIFGDICYEAASATAPHAICLAALKAKAKQEEQ